MTDNFENMIHDRLGELLTRLEEMTKEERLRFFKSSFLEDFLMEDGDTTYIVRTHYSDTAKESLQEKAERLFSKL